MNMLVFLRSNEHLGQDPSTLAGPSTAPLSPLLGQDVNCPGLSLVAGVLEPGGCGRDAVGPLFLRCVNLGLYFKKFYSRSLDVALSSHIMFTWEAVDKYIGLGL